MKTTNKKAFTLVELLVVVTIIAILSVVAYMAVGGQTVKARDAKRQQDLSTIQSSLEVYLIEKGSYPTSPLTSGIVAGQIPKKYLSEIPADPQGDTYTYVKSGVTYQIAATLEDDGDPVNFTAYVVGNSDIDLINPGVQWNAGTESFDVVCGDVIDEGVCLPYDPTD